MTDNRFPPWIDQSRITPELVMAWLVDDPLTQANLGEHMASEIVRVLAENNYRIVPVEQHQSMLLGNKEKADGATR